MRKSIVNWIVGALFAALLLCVPVFFAEGAAVVSPYRSGDIVTLGRYPQTQVTSASLIKKLNAVSGSWQPYAYTAGDGTPGTMQIREFAYYKDVSYDGERYRAVKYTGSRPPLVYGSLTDEAPLAEGGFAPGQVYWFRDEPIEWIVLDPAAGLLLSRRVLDSQPFCSSVYCKQTENPDGDPLFPELSYIEEFYGDSSFTVPANIYEDAGISAWLNGAFYRDAFPEETRGYIEPFFGAEEGPAAYAALPSAQELGLLQERDDDAAAGDLRASGTAYAASQGLAANDGAALWMLRTAAAGTDAVYAYGEELQTAITYVTFTGVRPVVRVNFGEHCAGDVDGDGQVTAADARCVLRISVGLTYLPDRALYYADADGSGDVSAADARLLLRYALRLEPESSLSHFFTPSYAAPEKLADGNKIFMDSITLTQGQSLSLAEYHPQQADTIFLWQSSAPENVSVTEKGVITGLSKGFACVYLSAGRQRYYYFVTVLTPLQQRIWALREKYPHGYYWNDYPKSEKYPYVTETPCTDHASGRYAHCIGQCAGFAILLSNEVFGKDAPYYRNVKINEIRVGDYIRCLPHHSVFVIDTVSKGDVVGYDIAKDRNKLAAYDSITVAECNWDTRCGIRWDRSIRLDTLSISSADSYSRCP